MKVQDCMTSPAHSCTPNANLVTAAGIMWDYKIAQDAKSDGKIG